MSSKLIALIGCGAALAVGAGTALAGASSGSSTCTEHLTNTPTGPGTGTEAGTVKCSKPAGSGTVMANYTYSVSGKTLTIKGTDTDTFKHGTIKGSFSLKGKTSSLSGTFKLISGTGKLSSAHGRGTETCTSTDAGATFNCRAHLTNGKL